MSIKHFLQLNYFLNGIPTKVLVQKQKLCYKLPTQKSQATEEKSSKQMEKYKTKSEVLHSHDLSPQRHITPTPSTQTE